MEVLALVTALSGWAFAVFLTISNRTDERIARDASERVLALRDEKINQLLDQVQLNAQNMPYYPTVGPFPADTTPEKDYYGSPDGLLVLSEEELTDAFGEIDRL